jgi:hypothetical protein
MAARQLDDGYPVESGVWGIYPCDAGESKGAGGYGQQGTATISPNHRKPRLTRRPTMLLP